MLFKKYSRADKYYQFTAGKLGVRGIDRGDAFHEKW